MTVHNPTVGRMFLINLFGKKVGDDDPAGGGRRNRNMLKVMVVAVLARTAGLLFCLGFCSVCVERPSHRQINALNPGVCMKCDVIYNS